MFTITTTTLIGSIWLMRVARQGQLPPPPSWWANNWKKTVKETDLNNSNQLSKEHRQMRGAEKNCCCWLWLLQETTPSFFRMACRKKLEGSSVKQRMTTKISSKFPGWISSLYTVEETFYPTDLNRMINGDCWQWTNEQTKEWMNENESKQESQNEWK